MRVQLHSERTQHTGRRIRGSSACCGCIPCARPRHSGAARRRNDEKARQTRSSEIRFICIECACFHVRAEAGAAARAPLLCDGGVSMSNLRPPCGLGRSQGKHDDNNGTLPT